MLATYIAPLGILGGTPVDLPWAARAEMTAAGRVCRTGHVALQDNALALIFNLGVGERHSGEQRQCIVMERAVVKRIPVR